MSSPVKNIRFGTTQIAGCQGDFCSYDISKTEDENFNKSNNRGDNYQIAGSTFRKRLMQSDSISADYSEGNFRLMSNVQDQSPNSGRKPFFNMMPYRTIIQAREEMPLVQMMLDKYNNKAEATKY